MVGKAIIFICIGLCDAIHMDSPTEVQRLPTYVSPLELKVQANPVSPKREKMDKKKAGECFSHGNFKGNGKRTIKRKAAAYKSNDLDPIKFKHAVYTVRHHARTGKIKGFRMNKGVPSYFVRFEECELGQCATCSKGNASAKRGHTIPMKNLTFDPAIPAQKLQQQEEALLNYQLQQNNLNLNSEIKPVQPARILAKKQKKESKAECNPLLQCVCDPTKICPAALSDACRCHPQNANLRSIDQDDTVCKRQRLDDSVYLDIVNTSLSSLESPPSTSPETFFDMALHDEVGSFDEDLLLDQKHCADVVTSSQPPNQAALFASDDILMEGTVADTNDSLDVLCENSPSDDVAHFFNSDDVFGPFLQETNSDDSLSFPSEKNDLAHAFNSDEAFDRLLQEQPDFMVSD